MLKKYTGMNVPGELTDEKIYEIVGQTKLCYIIKNDSGNEQFYSIASPSQDGEWIDA